MPRAPKKTLREIFGNNWPPPPDYLATVKQLAEELGCGVRRIYRAVKDGELAAKVINGRNELRIRWGDFAAWVDRLPNR